MIDTERMLDRVHSDAYEDGYEAGIEKAIEIVKGEKHDKWSYYYSDREFHDCMNREDDKIDDIIECLERYLDDRNADPTG